MPRDPGLYLDDILTSIGRIREYTASLSFEEFSGDQKTIDAILRNFEVIGEAVKTLPPEIKAKYAYDWRSVAGLRDILTHEYFGVSVKIVWDVLQNELPELERRVKEILEQEGP